MKDSCIITCGVGMQFNVCYNILKSEDFNDNTSQLYMYQINCDFFIHEACNKTFDNHNVLCILFLCV
jgi:hypothetical protein